MNEIPGVSPPLALYRLLKGLGCKVTLQTLEEEWDDDYSLQGISHKLRVNGFEARNVQAAMEDLPNLRTPTLLLTKAEEWIILKKCSARGFLVEHGEGVKLLTRSELEEAFSGTALEINKAFPEKGNLWVRLFKILPEYKKFLLLSFAITALAQGLSMVGPWLTATMTDTLQQGSASMLQILCLGMVASALFKAWVGFIRDMTLNAFTARIDAALETGVFDHLLHLPFRYLQGKTLGELIQVFSGMMRAKSLVLNKGMGSFFDAFTAISYLVYMLMLMPSATGAVVLGAVLLSCVTSVTGYFQAQETKKQIIASQAQSSSLAELIKGAPTLKATGSQHWVLDRWKGKLDEELSCDLRSDRIGLWEDVISGLLNHGSSAAILIWGGYKVLSGELSLGNLLAFSMLSSSFVGAISSLSQTVLDIALSKPQLKEVNAAFATERLQRAIPKGKVDLKSPIIVEDLWFRYKEKGPWIIQGMHLKVEPGTFHHVKGASGSGKSTLLKLLAGLYPPDTGRITIGGMDPGSAVSSMVFLPQFPQLASGSIMENLKIFSADAPKGRLMEVAGETGLGEWVDTLPMGYQTMVASGGTNFSGGQRQLVAITAVLASDKKLFLLDEALSNLDWISRQKIIKSPRLKGRTIIYASHEEVLMGGAEELVPEE